MQKLNLGEFIKLRDKNHLIIDTRPAAEFTAGFIKNSISIPFDEKFVQTLDELISDNWNIVFVTGANEGQNILNAVSSAGFTVAGYLDNGYEEWKNSGGQIDMMITIEADEFAMDYQFDEFYLVDVRAKEDFEKGRVEDSENIPLHDLEQALTELDPLENFYVYGYTAVDAVTAGSLFKRYGAERLRLIAASYNDILTCGVPLFVQKKKNQHVQKFPGGGLEEN